MVFGQGEHVYRVVEGWGGHFYTPFVEVVGLGVDHRDRVYVLIRSGDPVLVFDSSGNLLRTWGREHFSWPHGLHVGPDDSVYCTDGDHTVRKFTPDGRLLMTLGEKNHPSDTGAVGRDYRTIRHPAGPFNCPTDVALDAEGNIYVTDGYGNARVHKFSKDGELITSWGEPGRGLGQFNAPHGICIDGKRTVYVADRENSRVQLFDLDGRFLDQWDANRPTNLCVHDGCLYLTEVGYSAEPHLITTKPKDGVRTPRVSVFTLDGELLSRWGGTASCEPGNFFAPHAISVDSKGDLYVGEVAISSVGVGGRVPANCHTLQKFARAS